MVVSPAACCPWLLFVVVRQVSMQSWDRIGPDFCSASFFGSASVLLDHLPPALGESGPG